MPVITPGTEHLKMSKTPLVPLVVGKMPKEGEEHNKEKCRILQTEGRDVRRMPKGYKRLLKKQHLSDALKKAWG